MIEQTDSHTKSLIELMQQVELLQKLGIHLKLEQELLSERVLKLEQPPVDERVHREQMNQRINAIIQDASQEVLRSAEILYDSGYRADCGFVDTHIADQRSLGMAIEDLRYLRLRLSKS